MFHNAHSCSTTHSRPARALFFITLFMIIALVPFSCSAVRNTAVLVLAAEPAQTTTQNPQQTDEALFLPLILNVGDGETLPGDTTPTDEPTAEPTDEPTDEPTAEPTDEPTDPTDAAPTIAGCEIFPTNNIWNTPVDDLPLDPNSDTYVETIGADRTMHPDFGSGVWPPDSDAPIGIPYIVVPGTQPGIEATFDYADESDPGPYLIPLNAPIEGGPSSEGDRHALAIDSDNCILYELYSAYPQDNGTWEAGSGAIFDLNSHVLRPDGWTSSDAAGLPVLPGLVRYDEVAAGEIRHALRFTVPRTRNAYVWPARHYASSLDGTEYPPMGQRFRLKADFDISGFSPDTQVILRALKEYGMILADNGSSWYLSGAPDERWNNEELAELRQVRGSDFEAVDVSSLMVDADSGEARQ